MFFSIPYLILLVFPLVCAVFISFCVVKVFEKPIFAISRRIIQDRINVAFTKYVKYATYLFGISGGLIGHWSEEYMLDNYLSELTLDSQTSALNDDLMTDLRENLWLIMICSMIMVRITGTLHAIAQMYLVLFVIALISYIIVKIFEQRKA